MSATPSIVITDRSTYILREDYGHHTLVVCHENGTSARISVTGEVREALTRLADAADWGITTIASQRADEQEAAAIAAEEVEP